MPTQPVSGLPLGDTLWLQSALPSVPVAPAPQAYGWSADRSWTSRYGLGSVPANHSPFAPAPVWSAPTRGVAASGGQAPAWAAGAGTTAVLGYIGSVGEATIGMRSPFGSGLTYNSRLEYRLNQATSLSVASARRELAMGVREQGGANRGPRVDQYARTSRMGVGGMWCGFFVGFNYAQAGFREPERLASTYKAMRFFLYQDSNQLAAHRAQGSMRQFFVMPESPGQSNVRAFSRNIPGFDLRAHTFNWATLPLRPGDTVIFDRGNAGSQWPTHLGMVESYDRATGRLVTIEGNVSNRVVRKTYDLSNVNVRREITGFGRPAAGDFA